MYAELGVHVGNVGFGRDVRNIERLSDIGTRVAFGEHAHHFAFARREAVLAGNLVVHLLGALAPRTRQLVAHVVFRSLTDEATGRIDSRKNEKAAYGERANLKCVQRIRRRRNQRPAKAKQRDAHSHGTREDEFLLQAKRQLGDSATKPVQQSCRIRLLACRTPLKKPGVR